MLDVRRPGVSRRLLWLAAAVLLAACAAEPPSAPEPVPPPVAKATGFAALRGTVLGAESWTGRTRCPAPSAA